MPLKRTTTRALAASVALVAAGGTVAGAAVFHLPVLGFGAVNAGATSSQAAAPAVPVRTVAHKVTPIRVVKTRFVDQIVHHRAPSVAAAPAPAPAPLASAAPAPATRATETPTTVTPPTSTPPQAEPPESSDPGSGGHEGDDGHDGQDEHEGSNDGGGHHGGDDAVDAGQSAGGTQAGS